MTQVKVGGLEKKEGKRGRRNKMEEEKENAEVFAQDSEQGWER